jgi:hypothetical protein
MFFYRGIVIAASDRILSNQYDLGITLAGTVRPPNHPDHGFQQMELFLYHS